LVPLDRLVEPLGGGGEGRTRRLSGSAIRRASLKGRNRVSPRGKAACPTVDAQASAIEEIRAKLPTFEALEAEASVAWVAGFELYRTNIQIDAGMIQTTDGEDTYILTRRVLQDNAAIPNLRTRLAGWFGADELIFIDEQPGDLLGHINHFRFVAPKKVMLGVSEHKGTPVDRYLSALRALFDERGYEVIEIPYTERFEIRTPFGDTVNPALYANCVMMNDRMIVPVFDMEGVEPYNERAVAAYERALPNHQIVPLDVSVLAINGGGIYCGSKEIPDIARLRTA
jgi:agmatine/peptidylarginine deiminase